MLMIIAVLVVLGLCLGSFVNALVWRIHEQDKEQSRKKPDKRYLQRLSIARGRSICPNCQHELGVMDLLPVLSWLSLRGKCRYCHKPISVQYPLVELATAGLFVASYIWWPVAFTSSQDVLFGLWVLLLTGLMALLVYDYHWFLLPNRIIYPLAVPAAAWAAVSVGTANDRLVLLLSKLVLSVVISGGLFYVLYQVSQGKWIGGGDVRLGWLLGLIVLTPARAVLLIFTASLLGTVVSVPLLASKKLKKSSLIPFGPFLIVSVIIVQLFGASILAWYSRTFLSFN
jgi:prepilin signal peptidase PulO-like enzyme (type II secretory pathway)